MIYGEYMTDHLMRWMEHDGHDHTPRMDEWVRFTSRTRSLILWRCGYLLLLVCRLCGHGLYMLRGIRSLQLNGS